MFRGITLERSRFRQIPTNFLTHVSTATQPHVYDEGLTPINDIANPPPPMADHLAPRKQGEAGGGDPRHGSRFASVGRGKKFREIDELPRSYLGHQLLGEARNAVPEQDALARAGR